MSYAARQYAGRAWTGLGDGSSSGGGVVVDPANPGASGWSWRTQTGTAPWASGAWAGGGQVQQATDGGLTAYPDPDLGVVRLSAWWTEAAYLRIVRLVGSTRTPVRGASPLTVAAATRHNYCTNPSFEVDTSGWLAGTNTTLSRQTIRPFVGTAHGRLVATASGTVIVTVPVALPLPEGAPRVSLGLYLPAAPSGALTWTVAWKDGAGTSLGSTTAVIPSGSLTAFVGRWDRTAPQALAVPAAAVTGTLTLSIAGMAAGGIADLDAVLIEPAALAAGVYFDGDSPYAGWTATAHASLSSLATPTTWVDAEAPLDVPVLYELSAPSQPALRVVSEPVTLPSGDRTWLTHPVDQQPFVVTVLDEPEQTRTITRGVHQIIGRANPIAVSASQRSSSAGSLEVLVTSFDDRDRVWALLDDGQPLLLRAPARLGHGLGEWLSVGDATLKRPGHGAWEDARTFTLPYVVVDAPAANPDDPVAA